MSRPPLPPCPRRPNCVSSQGAGPAHRVEPFRFGGPPAEAWAAARHAVASLPRTRIVEESEGSLRAEVRSRVFRFVDDLELRMADGEGCIHVRSASRVGYSDLGVNRRRVEAIRERLRADGFR